MADQVFEEYRSEVGELRDAVREVSSDLRMFMSRTTEQIGKFNEFMAMSARNEERLIHMLEDQKRLVADMKDVTKRMDEQRSRCERTVERLDEVRAWHEKLAERVDTLRDEHKEMRHKAVAWAAVGALLVGPAASVVVAKLAGGG